MPSNGRGEVLCKDHREGVCKDDLDRSEKGALRNEKLARSMDKGNGPR